MRSSKIPRASFLSVVGHGLLLFAAANALAAQPSPGARPGPPTAPPGPVDGIRIVEVLPGKVFVGEEQEIFVRVRYELRSRDEANVQLGFNTTGATRFRVFDKELVAKGEGEVALSARVTPRDWGKLVFFQAFASLSDPMPPPPPRPSPSSPPPAPVRAGRPALAVDHAPIPLTLRQTAN